MRRVLPKYRSVRQAFLDQVTKLTGKTVAVMEVPL
jgi:hypothetical protein